ncbi:MAG: hypothetical protein KDC71_19430 [Acidobacteria bacterium]|nr:hypothetical protein [Acidobacteriota bacterium]
MRIGIFGKGRLAQAIAEKAGPQVAWQVSREAAPHHEIDVAIEASSGQVVDQRLAWALEHGIPLVIGSTGWQIPDLKARVAERIGVVIAPNFSLTVAFMLRLGIYLARFADRLPETDPYLYEHHQARKKDAPSGTARLIADSLIPHLSRKTGWSLPQQGQPFPPEHLCVSSMRAGSTYSSHILGLDGPDEVFEIHHHARSAGAYAQGALEACRFILNRRGIFSFGSVAASFLDPVFEEVPS